MKIITGWAIALALLACSLAWSHGGRVDSNGGHTDRATGLYHCHREPCLSSGSNEPADSAARDAPFVLLYERDDWPHWIDVDGDCQNTRHEVLIRDSLVRPGFRRGETCTVVTGQWLDPYTGELYRRASQVSIDHLVPLRWAHGHGADRWTRTQKTRFANDMDNLLAVGTRVNAQKGARGPDDWLPPEAGYRCEYLSRFVEIMARYQLHFVDVERKALQEEFHRCELAS